MYGQDGQDGITKSFDSLQEKVTISCLALPGLYHPREPRGKILEIRNQERVEF